MGIKGVDDTTFKIRKGKERITSENYWGNVRIIKDSKTNEEYIDVLVGIKNETRPHVHIGINLDQSLRFVESRDELVTIRRKVESKLRGKLKDETVSYKSNKPAGATLTFDVIVDDPTKTIEVKFRDMILSEK